MDESLSEEQAAEFEEHVDSTTAPVETNDFNDSQPSPSLEVLDNNGPSSYEQPTEPLTTSTTDLEKRLKDQGYEFPTELLSDFDNLLFIGDLKRTFKYLGRDIYIQTMRTRELIEVSTIVARYEGQMAHAKAYQTAIVAACLISVDGKSPIEPIGINESRIDVRFNWVADNLYMPVIEKIYNEYVALEKKLAEIIEHLEGKV